MGISAKPVGKYRMIAVRGAGKIDAVFHAERLVKEMLAA